jgi:hypothetical protein
MAWAKRNAMFFRVTRAGRDQHVQIAPSYREGSATKQQTLPSLGRLDVLQAGGQLDALLRSGLRLSDRPIWAVKSFGILFRDFWTRMKD